MKLRTPASTIRPGASLPASTGTRVRRGRFGIWQWIVCWTWVFGIGGFPAYAEVPEPDNLIYGVIQLGVSPVTAANSNVLVEARKSGSNGPVVATYRMGESSLAGNYYSLRIPIEAFNPLTDTNASRVGALLHLSVRDESGVRITRTASIASRGKLVRLDFTQPDTDGDGLPDSWEQQYFQHITNGDPNGDPDGDGRDNLTEYLAGTNPLVPDGRHPADSAPANNFLAITEAENYAEAWLVGARWPASPTNIPIAYVTSAALLALNGGTYVFTNLPPTNAPHWWVNVPAPTRRHQGTNHAIADMSPSGVPGVPLTVTIDVQPHEFVQVYAVEDTVPEGWEILSVSHGGSFDAANNKVKWGPFFDSGDRAFVYQAVPAPLTNVVALTGTASFDGHNVPIGGVRSILLGYGGLPLRWAAHFKTPSGPAYLLSGEADHAYVIEVSSDGAEWNAVQTISTDFSGQFLFRPPAPLADKYKLFRARTQ